MAGTVTIGGTAWNVLPWPSMTITPAIEWVQDAAGYWNGSDRGYAQDIYEAGVTFAGTETTINSLEQALDAARESVTLSSINAPLFAPNVDHSGSITAAVLGMERRQVQYGLSSHVYRLEVKFRAIAPTLISTTPSLTGLKPVEGFEAGHTYESPKAFTYSQSAIYADHRSDIGTLDAECIQNRSQAGAVLTYVLSTARATAVAFPSSLSSIAYPWGRSRGSATNCKITSVAISRVNQNRWAIRLRLVEST